MNETLAYLLHVIRSLSDPSTEIRLVELIADRSETHDVKFLCKKF